MSVFLFIYPLLGPAQRLLLAIHYSVEPFPRSYTIPFRMLVYLFTRFEGLPKDS